MPIKIWIVHDLISINDNNSFWNVAIVGGVLGSVCVLVALEFRRKNKTNKDAQIHEKATVGETI